MAKVEFKVLPTGDSDLEQVQQNITDLANALQSAQASAGQGITLVSADYTLKTTDRFLLVSSNSQVAITLGAPNVMLVCTVIVLGPGTATVRTADNKTDLGSVMPASPLTVVCDGKSWSGHGAA